MTDNTARNLNDCLGYALDALSVGMSASVARTVGEADILAFAGVSGDTNPVHVDAEFAEASMFGGRIAHGMLSAAYLSTVLGTRLPGPGCIYLSQTLRFKAPVKIGDTVEARVTVKEIKTDKRRVVLTTECLVKGKVVTTGEAEIMIPARET